MKTFPLFALSGYVGSAMSIPFSDTDKLGVLTSDTKVDLVNFGDLGSGDQEYYMYEPTTAPVEASGNYEILEGLEKEPNSLMEKIAEKIMTPVYALYARLSWENDDIK